MRAIELLLLRAHRRRTLYSAFGAGALGLAIGIMIEVELLGLAILVAAAAGIAFKLAR